MTLTGHYNVEEVAGFFLLLGYLTAWLLIFLLMFAFAWQECDKIMQSYDSHRTNTDCKLYIMLSWPAVYKAMNMPANSMLMIFCSQVYSWMNDLYFF